MQNPTVFLAANAIASIQWLMLIVSPRWQVTQFLVRYAVVPVLLSALYVVYIASFFSVPDVGFGSIEQVRNLFNNDQLLIAGWVHYLAFDLLVGFWILRSSQKKHVSHWLTVSCLIGTFMFGPCGFLLFLITQQFTKANADNPSNPDQE